MASLTIIIIIIIIIMMIIIIINDIKNIAEARHQHCRLLEVKPLTMIFPLHHMIAGHFEDDAKSMMTMKRKMRR